VQELSFRHGDLIFNEGDVSDVAYLVMSGKVEIFKRYPKGTVLLATLTEGDMCGEMGIVNDEPRTASAMAADMDVKLRIVTRGEIQAMIASQPEGGGLIMRALMRRLKQANEMLITLVNKQTDFEFLNLDAPAAVKRVTLLPGSDIMRKLINKNGMMLVNLPFRVGMVPAGVDPAMMGDLNDFFVTDGDASQMSRNHFAIQRTDKGLCVMDRGSKTGTIVNRKKIGGGIKILKEDLHLGENEIVAGDMNSPYKFTVIWE